MSKPTTNGFAIEGTLQPVLMINNNCLPLHTLTRINQKGGQDSDKNDQQQTERAVDDAAGETHIIKVQK